MSLWDAGEAIARRLDVDLVDLGSASTVMQFQIVTTGRRLFAADQSADRYEMFILREMTDFSRAILRPPQAPRRPSQRRRRVLTSRPDGNNGTLGLSMTVGSVAKPISSMLPWGPRARTISSTSPRPTRSPTPG